MTVLVTGGGGFLGGAIIRQLLAQGHRVRSFSRGSYAQLQRLGVEQFQGDLADLAAVRNAVKGCQVVFHVAALPGIWGAFAAYHATNVVGTRHVLQACREASVHKLIYTSSPSVVFDGNDMEGVDESVPYPSRYLAHYPATKAEAERAVLAANGPALATVSLRPHLIWGPGDNHLVPRILERGRKGQLRRIGSCSPLVDSTYIDDAATAHLLAADKVDGPAAGKAYFISSGEPWPLWDLVNGILAAGGVLPVVKTIPRSLAYTLGALLETLYRIGGIAREPRMTRFLAKELSTAHWFDLSAAKRDLGYRPRVSIREGLERLSHSLKKTDGKAKNH